MQKSTLEATPKELLQKRILKNKLYKDPFIGLQNFNKFKENLAPSDNTPKKITKKISYTIKKPMVKAKTVKERHAITYSNLADKLFTKSAKPKKQIPISFNFDEPITICDYYETFYKIIEGRPMRQPNDIKVYMKNLRDIMLTKADVSYLNDEILRIDAFNTDEGVILNKIDDMFLKIKHAFFHFVGEDYTNSLEIQNQENIMASKVALLKDQLAAYSFKKIGIRNQLDALELLYETLARYKKFIYSVSPPFWLNEHPHLDLKQLLPTTMDMDSKEALDIFRANYEKLSCFRTELYFETPRQLIEFFDEEAFQCINNMAHHASLKRMLNTIVSRKNTIDFFFELEVKEVNDIVQSFKSCVELIEENELIHKNKFEKLILNTFTQLYCSFESAKLFTCVQFVHTKIFEATEDPKDCLRTLMTQLEGRYFELIMDLDCLSQSVVKDAVKEIFAEDMKTMATAHQAQRSLKEYNILTKALTASFEPPRYIVTKKK